MFRWCWHDWSKWKSYRFVGTSYGGPGSLVTGDMTARKISETRQTRACKKCGKELHRRVANGTGALFDLTEPLTQ